MSAAFTVRALERDDAAAMTALFSLRETQRQTLQLPYPDPAVWQRRLAAQRGHDLAAIDSQGRLIGEASLFFHESPRQRHAAEIAIAVADDWQRRGVGNALMTALLDLADNWLGLDRVALTVYSDNSGAIALYHKFGFVSEGLMRCYALRDGQYCDALHMARLRQP